MRCNTISFVSRLIRKCFMRESLDIFEDVCSLHTCFSADSFRLLCCITPCECSGRFFCATRYLRFIFIQLQTTFSYPSTGSCSTSDGKFNCSVPSSWVSFYAYRTCHLNFKLPRRRSQIVAASGAVYLLVLNIFFHHKWKQKIKIRSQNLVFFSRSITL